MGDMGCLCSILGRRYSGTVSPQRGTAATTAVTIITAVDGDPPLTFELVRSWSDSFDELMKSRTGQKILADFLKSEFSDENILFWQACEELKKERNAEKMEEKARIIYEDFISILSPKEISLDSKAREEINSNMGRPTNQCFASAQEQIYMLMARDSYPRFIQSSFYKACRDQFGVRDLQEEERIAERSATTTEQN